MRTENLCFREGFVDGSSCQYASQFVCALLLCHLGTSKNQHTTPTAIYYITSNTSFAHANSPPITRHIFPNLSLSRNIFTQPREDTCPLAPIFNPSKLGFCHNSNIPRYLTRKLNLYGEPPLISTNPSTQISKSTLDYP